ncbi:uncharacterized protein LOC143274790 isoform X2 [Babylonia areolata]
MDDANQKIDHYSGTRKSGGMSLEEYPIDPTSQSAKDSGCDEVVSTAIAEVSKDFTSGNLSTGPLVSGESDESHLSSDNDGRYRRGASYARYPETAAGLSDNDWNPYVTESDTNTSPRLAGDMRPGSFFASNGDSKINSLASSFNPPLCSTKTGSASRISKTTLQLTNPRSVPDGSLHLSDIKEHSDLSIRSISSLKADASISPPQMTSSKLSEYSFEKQSYQARDPSGPSLSQSRGEAARTLKKCFERTSWPPSPEKTTAAGRSGQERPLEGSSGTQHKVESRTDRTGIEDSFKKLRSFGDEGDTWEIKSSLPGRGYFSDAVKSVLSGDKGAATERRSLTSGFEKETDAQKSKMTSTSIDYSHVKSDAGITREKMNREMTGSKDSEKSGQARLSRESEAYTSSTGSSTNTVIPSAAAASRKSESATSSESAHHNRLSEQVNKLLQETAYLTGSSRAKEKAVEKKPANSATSLDYDRLHRDLQEIQDSLLTMGQPGISPRLTTTAPPTTAKSDSDDGDIVPSTSTTPERARRLMWDYGADLGYRGGHLDNLESMMSDVTSESSPLDARGKHDRINYTSDGEETRTSSMDHAEEEEHHEDNNLTMTNQLGQVAAAATSGGGMDLEQLISKTRAMEDRYQAVRSQGMADKVISILTSTKPDQQAEGILSEISAEERELSLRMAAHGFGSHLDSSSSPNNTFMGLKTNDSIRKRLDMSSLSDSEDSDRLLNSYLESNPKLEAMFSATSAAQSLISAQVKKMAERTFSHSMELRSPVRQELHCYPVYSSQRDQPQYQLLQQQLERQLQRSREERQQALQQQQQQQQQTKPKEAWTEKEKSPEAKKSPREELTGKSEPLRAEEKARSPTGEDSPGSVTSPAESDKSSEFHRAKYRPYRPAGSQDVYYTESDTASVAESVTTVESTHTGSDDAVAPYFPSNLLGSRHAPGGGEPGLYSKHSKIPGPVGATTEPHLPTIQERSTPESSDRFSSDVSDKGTSRAPDSGLKGQGSRIPMLTGGSGGLRHNPVRQPDPASVGGPGSGVVGAAGGSSSMSSIMARQQARVESIVREKDSARKLPVSEASHTKSHEEGPSEKTKDDDVPEGSQSTRTSHTRPSSSPDSAQRSRIPVRGPPPNYEAALRSKIMDPKPSSSLLPEAEENVNASRQPSFTDRSIVRSPEDQPGACQDVVASTSEEDRLLQAIDAQVETEILKKNPKESSAENSDNGSAKSAEEQPAASGHEARSPPHSDEDGGKVPSGEEHVDGGDSKAASSLPGEDRWAQRSESDRKRQAADSATLPHQDVEIDEAVVDKRQEEVELIYQQEQRKQQEASQALQEQLRKDVERELRAQEQLRKDLGMEPRATGGQSRRNTHPHASADESSEAEDPIEQGKTELNEAIADKRREEVELERRHLEAQIAKEREHSQALLQAREQEIREAQARRQEVLAAAEARREAGLQRERELRREMEREQEAAARLRREAEMRREAELRQQAELRREAEMRREQERQREAEIQREAELREMEARREAERVRAQEATLLKEAEMRREAELERDTVRASEEALVKEIELAREVERQRRDRYWEAERQREAEEAIERAGGSELHTDSVSIQDAEREAIKAVLRKGQGVLGNKEVEEAVDRQPMSHRAQLLRESLEQEVAYQRPDLHILWERFMAGSNAGQEPDSSLNSEKVNMLADLMRDPTQHLVQTFLSQRQKQHQEDRQRAAACRQAVCQKQAEDDQKNEEKRAALERELRRQEARRQQQRLSSEEESNGSYGEILQQREQDRLKRREVRTQRKKLGKSPSPSSSISKQKDGSGQAPVGASQGDTMETLYSIPEDMSLDASPQKSRSPHRPHVQQRRADVIDPHMNKLRHRIDQQRKKISKEKVKEAHREQKLDKLKALLNAKQSGLLDDRAIAALLGSISSTSAGSSDDTGTLHSHSTAFSDHTTTAKDSSAEMQRAKLANSPLRRGGRHTVELSMDSEFTHLQEDSSQTETDYSAYQGEGHFRATKSPTQSYKRSSPSYHPSKHGGKFMKLHQMYSPYNRHEAAQPRWVKDAGKLRSPVERDVSGQLKDAGTMYPSPKPQYPTLHKLHHRGSRLVTRGVQTSPDPRRSQRRTRPFSPPSEDKPAVLVPSMSPKARGRDFAFQAGKGFGRVQRKSPSSRLPRQSRSISPAFDSSQVAACLSPDRNRPSSASPARSDRHRRRSPSPTRHRSPSPVELRLKAWTERESRSPLRDPRFHRKTSPARLQERFSPPRRLKSYDFDGENRAPVRHQQQVKPSAPSSWFIPMKEDKPWRQPLKERQAYAVSREDWPPTTTLTNQKWRELARADLEGLEGGLRGSVEGDAARLYLHRSTKEAEAELGQQYDKFDDKPLCRMSLQEALMSRRPNFVSSLRQRQKRVKLAAENRQLQALVRAEQERIFADQRLKNANPDAHPYSENLHHPKRRVFSKQEMKEMTEKIYKRLPEVKQMEIQKRRTEEYRLNRLRARVFTKRVQRKVLDRKVGAC